jgi:hypothetical protein
MGVCSTRKLLCISHIYHSISWSPNDHFTGTGEVILNHGAEVACLHYFNSVSLSIINLMGRKIQFFKKLHRGGGGGGGGKPHQNLI